MRPALALPKKVREVPGLPDTLRDARNGPDIPSSPTSTRGRTKLSRFSGDYFSVGSQFLNHPELQHPPRN